MTCAQLDAGRRCNAEKNKSVTSYILHPKLTIVIPRTEKSLELRLVGKVTKRSKQDLRGLLDTIAYGGVVTQTSPTTTKIQKPSAREVKVRNNDIAKFGNKAGRNTPL